MLLYGKHCDYFTMLDLQERSISNPDDCSIQHIQHVFPKQHTHCACKTERYIPVHVSGTVREYR